MSVYVVVKSECVDKINVLLCCCRSG